MPTGEYNVAKGKTRGKIRNSDNSFISCMFAIFLFILLCIILILIMLAVKWKKESDELETDEAYSDKSRGTSTNSTTTTTTTTTTTAATITDKERMILKLENSTTIFIRPTTSSRVTFETSTVMPTSRASTLKTEQAPLSPEDGGTTSGEISSSATEIESSSLIPELTDKSTAKMGVEDRGNMTTEVITMLSTDHEGSTSSMAFDIDVPMTSETATMETESTSDSSLEERRGSDVTSSTDKTVSPEPEDFSASNTDVTPTVSDIMTETTTNTNMSTGVPEDISTVVPSSSESDTTVPTDPEGYPTTNTDETTSDIPSTSSEFAETMTVSTTSTPLDFTNMTDTSPTELGYPTTNTDETTSDIPSTSSEFAENMTVSTTSTPLDFTNMTDTSPTELGYPTTNTDEITSDIPTTSSEFAETMTVSATSTPLDFTDVTDTSSTELPTSVITISPKKVNDTCDKLECKRLAGRMLAQMGHEFNPCDNFYMYACGGIHSDPFLQPYDYTVDMMDRIRHGMERESHSQPAFLKFASFYSSCMEANDVEFQLARELIKILKDIGDFLDPASGKAVDFTHFFAEIISLHRPLLFDIIVDVDDSNSDRYMLKMTTPIHENPFRFGSQIPAECNQGPDIKNNSNFNDVYEDIKTCEVDLKITSLGNGISEIFAALNRTDNYTIHLHHYDAVLSSAEWMSIFYKMEPSESERRHSVITKNYTLVTVSDLNKNYPVINWTVLLEKLLGKSVPDNTSVQLYSAEYFNQLFDNFQEGNFVKIYNSLLAAFVQQLREDLVLNMSPVEGYCLTVAAKLMEDVAAGAYLNSFNRTELDLKRRSVETIFKQLRDTFKQLLHSSDWLVSDRDALLKKLDSMTLAADGGVNIFTMDKLNNQMSSVNISKEPDSYVRNSIALLRRYRSNIYKSLDGKPRDLANVWSHFSLPQEAYGISIYGINTVAMPYAMLAWPFFHNNYPEYLQIAGLGHIIAHEMSHHFDNVGMKYNPKGELEMMLHGPAQELYSNMETCFAEQFNTPESQQSEDGKTFTFTLNPELHREEQLADDIATLLLYSLFKNRSYDLYAEQLPFLEMNNDQVFFLHLAQSFCTKDTLQSGIVSLFENEHLPSLLRVNHFLSQSKDFSEVFNCPADSKMNPTHRCEVFPALNRTPA